jgi:hypothetical protein
MPVQTLPDIVSAVCVEAPLSGFRMPTAARPGRLTHSAIDRCQASSGDSNPAFQPDGVSETH